MAFHPGCTYDVNARIEATIKVGDELYHSHATYRDTHSRDWISTINHGGCIEPTGGVLVFLLNNGAVILVPNGLCASSERTLIMEGQSDVVADCNGRPRPDGDAFALDNGVTPRLWKPLTWGDEVRLVSMQATTSPFASPDDLLDQRAPGVLSARFIGYVRWWDSPERVIPWQRRRDRGEDFRSSVQLGQFDFE